MNEHHVMTVPYVTGAVAGLASLATITPWWVGALAAVPAFVYTAVATAYPASKAALRVGGETV